MFQPLHTKLTVEQLPEDEIKLTSTGIAVATQTLYFRAKVVAIGELVKSPIVVGDVVYIPKQGVYCVVEDVKDPSKKVMVVDDANVFGKDTNDEMDSYVKTSNALENGTSLPDGVGVASIAPALDSSKPNLTNTY